MITLDSASGSIDIPKVNDYEELMRQIKKVLRINDELFQHLYFSYIDEEDQERTRLIPQIYDDFINQESPKLSIGFLDNLNQEILDQFTEIIDENKKRFEKKKESDEISNEDNDESDSKKQKENIEINLTESNENLENNLKDELKFESDIPSNKIKLENKVELEDIDNGNKKDNNIPEKGIIIINNNEEINKENDIPEKGIIIINNEEKKENGINNENENYNSSKKLINEKNINESEEIKNNKENKNINTIKNNNEILISIENDEKENKKEIISNKKNSDKKENNNDNNLIIKKKESDNCFNLFSSDVNNNDIKIHSNINNNKENINDKKNGDLDDSEFNLKVFEDEFNNKFNNLQKSMKNSNIEEYNKNKELIEKDFENNIKNIIEANVDNMKNEIIHSIIIETSKIENKSKLNQQNLKNKTIHRGFVCDNCKMFPIVGIRYKCMECDDFDLCENCEKIKTHPHLFYKIKKNNFNY